MPLSPPTAHAAGTRRRVLLCVVVACWSLGLATPAAPTVGPVTEATPTPTLAETAPDGAADDADRDPELVPSLVAIVLLGVTIGLHAVYRDPR